MRAASSLEVPRDPQPRPAQQLVAHTPTLLACPTTSTPRRLFLSNRVSKRVCGENGLLDGFVLYRRTPFQEATTQQRSQSSPRGERHRPEVLISVSVVTAMCSRLYGSVC